MTDAIAASPTSEPASRTASTVLPWLILLFIGSGAAALVYEIVWFQLLSLIVGSSAISLGILLATFMGGMCIGSLSLSRYISTREHPLRVYALLEFGIAIWGVLVLWILPLVGGLYTSIGGPGIAGLLTRGLFCGIFLLPPTIMMGATLPAIARWVKATPKGVSWLGFFYGGNTVGAVFGSLLAGFYLLRVFDVTVATFTAVALNVIVAALALFIAKRTAYEPVVDPSESAGSDGAERLPAGARWVLVAIGLSGLTALGAQVIWVRLLTLNLGGTVYTFSLILAAFLTGIGLGSGLGSIIAGSVRSPRLALGTCQLLLTACLAWAAYMLTTGLPYWPVNPALATSPWINFQLDFLQALVVVMPAALLWGASFPLALGAVASERQDTGRMVGVVYAANTLGAIVGALLSSLFLVGTLGTQNAQRIMVAIAGVSALILLVPTLSEVGERVTVRARGAVLGLVTLGLATVMAVMIPAVPGLLVGYGRYAATWIGYHGEFIMVGEGMNSSMAVSRMPNGVLNYHNAGKVQASSEPQDMRLQRMLGHLTTLVPESVESVMVIGCGAGVTAGAVSIDPAVTDLTIVEIEPLVPEFVATNFGEHNFQVIDNPKTTVEIDDARHYLLTTDRTFDAITSDPFDPWVKGAATLYTREFWQVARERLNPGGVITVFVQLYESNLEAVKSEVATFFEVFPEGMVFANLNRGQGYDVVMLGQNDPGPIDLDRIDEKLARPEYAQVRRSLSEIGFNSAPELFSTFAVRKPEIDPWLEDAQINRDRNLRLQYLAGFGVNLYQADEIYRDMARYRAFPEGLFVGTVDRMQQLWLAFQTNGQE